MQRALQFLRDRAENVAAAMIAAMFVLFIVQIAARYVFNAPLGWTTEACLTLWLWLVFWGGAFVLDERDHVRFDVLYLAVGAPLRRKFAIVSALAISGGLLAALPATLDYISFYKIKSSSILLIRLDIVFSIYGIFAAALVLRYGLRAWRLARGADPETLEGAPRP